MYVVKHVCTQCHYKHFCVQCVIGIPPRQVLHVRGRRCTPGAVRIRRPILWHRHQRPATGQTAVPHGVRILPWSRHHDVLQGPSQRRHRDTCSPATSCDGGPCLRPTTTTTSTTLHGGWSSGLCPTPTSLRSAPYREKRTSNMKLASMRRNCIRVSAEGSIKIILHIYAKYLV